MKIQQKSNFLFNLTAVFAPILMAQTPSFEGLRQMPGAAIGAGTYGPAISGYGSTIMGYAWVCANAQSECSSTDLVQAYRWTVAGGYQILGSPGRIFGTVS